MEVLQDLVAPLKKPAFYGLCIGHGKYKATLPLGVRASIDAGNCKLAIEESAVQ
jgi:muramoyltetrapeptide carboxypeptidase